MSADVNLTFRNNQIWLLVFSMSQWASLYDLTQGSFVMQARVNPTDVLPAYQWASEGTANWGGAITYDPTSKLLLISAPYADMRGLAAGNYSYDLQYTIDIGGVAILVRDLAAGTLTVTQGVTQT